MLDIEREQWAAMGIGEKVLSSVVLVLCLGISLTSYLLAGRK